MRHVLFVCEGNLHRSPTAEALYRDTVGLDVRSAGLASTARVQLTQELLAWADMVFVMERRLEETLRAAFGPLVSGKTIVCLDIPDHYQRMDPDLVSLLVERLAPHIGPPARKEE